MKKYANLIPLSALMLVLLITSGCSAPKPAGLTDQQVTGLTENVLKALDANDYQNFTRDFSEEMKSAFPQEQVTALQALLGKSSGKFVSVGTPTLSNNQGYAVYRIPCKYENETVYVTITFLIDGQKVEGLFFDSANLRKPVQ
jgi:uncharacterized protein YcfL